MPISVQTSMESPIHNLRVTVRSLLKAPAFTAVVVLILALGIGANTALYSVVNHVLLRPLSFPEPDRLAVVWEHWPDDSGRMRKGRATAGNFRDWREQSQSFETMAMFAAAGGNWTGDGEPEQLLGAAVTAEYFDVLGVQPVQGRFFTPEELVSGEERVMVLSQGLWQRRFGGEDVIGRSILLDDSPIEIIGVAPHAVYPTWPQSTGELRLLPVYQQYFVPLRLSEERASDRRSHVYGVIGRLADDSSLETARAEMDTIARRLEAAHPRANEGERTLVVPYMDEIYGGTRPAMFVLLAAVGLTMLAACANMAGLFLTRSQGRRQDFAVRAALGASRWDLARQLISESVVLALAGAVLGSAVARFGVDLVVRLSPQFIPRLAESTLDGQALAFAFGLALLSAILVAVLPALSVTKPVASGRRVIQGQRLGRGLVVAEIALAVVLVVAAGLLVRSFWKLQEVDLGYRAENVLVTEVSLPRSRYPDSASLTRFFDQTLERIASLPGVLSASIAYDHPLDSSWSDSFRLVDSSDPEESLGATFRIVSPDYFRTVGIDVVRGRAFTPLDDPEHPGAVIVNEAFERRYFAGESAIGSAIETSTPNNFDASLPKVFEIVGVVRNVKFLGPTANDEPAFYVPSLQFPQRGMVLLVQTQESPLGLADAVREAIWAFDPNLPLDSMNTLAQIESDALAEPRFSALLVALFGASALLLSALGIYGVLSYDVTRRTNEIGIRMALGARRTSVVALVLGQSARLTAVGLSLGLAAAWLVSRALAGLLFGVSPSDAATFVGGALSLFLVALASGFLPARRATRVAPVTALRYE